MIDRIEELRMSHFSTQTVRVLFERPSKQRTGSAPRPRESPCLPAGIRIIDELALEEWFDDPDDGVVQDAVAYGSLVDVPGFGSLTMKAS